MRVWFRNYLMIFIFSVLLMAISSGLLAQEIRPVRDDVGFCWTADEVNTLMEYLAENDASDFPKENLVAAISPHDDYLYAGRVYAPLYKLIKTKEVVVFGVTHGTVRRAMNDAKDILILDDYDLWKGPYGNVGISPLREKIKSGLDTSYYMVSNKAQSIEHSIEALIPFLQYYNRDIKITPIMVTAMPLERINDISKKLSGIILEYIRTNNLQLGKDIFFLISNDCNHYGKDFDNDKFGEDMRAHETATQVDKQIAEESFDGEITQNSIKSITGKIWESDNNKDTCPLWCGRYPIVFGLTTVSKITNGLNLGNISGRVFRYSDTFTEGVLPVKGTTLGTTAPFSFKHWVGFLSAGFYIKSSE